MKENLGLLGVTAASPYIELAAPQKNILKHIPLIEAAAQKGSAVILFPELSLTGATAGRLIWQDKLLGAVEEALISLLGVSEQYPELLIAVGAPLRSGSKLYKAQLLILGGAFAGACAAGTEGLERGLRDGQIYDPFPLGSEETITLRGHQIHLGSSFFRFRRGHDQLTLAVLFDGDLRSPLLRAAACEEAELILCPAARPRLIASRRTLFEQYRQFSRDEAAAVLFANAGSGESSADEVFAGELFAAEDGKIVSFSETGFGTEAGLMHSYVDIAYLRARRRQTKPQAGALTGFCSFEQVYTEISEPSLTEQLPDLKLRPVDPYPFVPADPEILEERCEAALSIQAAGLARRLRQIGCEQIILGVSGGLDSTLALLVSVRALAQNGLGPENILAVTLPGFGTSDETRSNAHGLMQALGVTEREISIVPAVLQHFKDIGHDKDAHDVTYENTQARERTQILMDLANKLGGILVGTGDLSELALGWCTYNGDHISMYAVNASIPKTLIRPLLAHEGRRYEADGNGELAQILKRISETPVSPELLPPDPSGKIAQKTEDLVGPYVLHDFFLYQSLRRGASPEKILRLAEEAFGPQGAAEETFSLGEISKWLKFFYKRFFTQQFKRNCSTDGAAVGSINFSPRQGFYLPPDADGSLFTESI